MPTAASAFESCLPDEVKSSSLFELLFWLQNYCEVVPTRGWDTCMGCKGSQVQTLWSGCRPQRQHSNLVFPTKMKSSSAMGCFFCLIVFQEAAPTDCRDAWFGALQGEAK
jgi:hypothetical protein